MNIITDEIYYEEDGEMVYICRGYITKKGKVKIYPFALENIAKRFNLRKFPHRQRPDPKILRKYNFLGNIYIVAGYKYVESSNFVKRSSIYIARKIKEEIDIPEEVIKTKISQLKSYIKTNKKTCSYDLIKTYLNFKNVPYSAFEDVIVTRHNTLFEKRKAFDELLRYFKSEYNYELD